MFKKISELEKAMCSILKKIVDSSNIHIVLNNLDKLSSIALFQCVKENFVENIDLYTDSNGEHHFSSLGNTYINKNGLKFIRNMSLGYRFKNCIFEILKGTTGFVAGVATTVIAEIILWLLIN